MAKEMYCVNCGAVGQPKTYTKGTMAMEILLWLLFIVPGVLYSLWRLTSRYKGCPQCKAPNMIPSTSPKAAAAIKAAGGA